MFYFILLVFILVNYGMSNIVVYARGPFHIFEWWRNTAFKIHPQLGEMFSCMICYPTWNAIMLTGLSYLIGIQLTPFTIVFNWEYPIITALLDGAIGSGTTWIIHNIEEWFEKNAGILYEDQTEEQEPIKVTEDVTRRDK